MSSIAVLLTVLGLAPFIACGLAALGPNPQTAARMTTALIDYGALILSFVGAVHWGLVLAPTGTDRRLPAVWMVVAAVPMLLGWLALSLGDDLALVVLIAGSLATVLGERQASRRSLLPPGYLWLRYGFTVVSVAMLTTVLTLRLLGQTIAF
jgi:ABC-type uncharacterized transport system permease subunit